jgi:hypothetical protein
MKQLLAAYPDDAKVVIVYQPSYPMMSGISGVADNIACAQAELDEYGPDDDDDEDAEPAAPPALPTTVDTVYIAASGGNTYAPAGVYNAVRS